MGVDQGSIKLTPEIIAVIVSGLFTLIASVLTALSYKAKVAAEKNLLDVQSERQSFELSSEVIGQVGRQHKQILDLQAQIVDLNKNFMECIDIKQVLETRLHSVERALNKTQRELERYIKEQNGKKEETYA